MFSLENGLASLFIAATLLTVIFVFFLIGTLVRLKSRQQKKEQQLLRSLIDERERTMYMISTEIHDNASQVLNLARMTMGMIKKHAVPEQSKYISEMGNMLDNVIAELRNVSHSLNTEFLKSRGMIDIITEEAKWINISHQLNCNFTVEGNPKMFAQDTELMLIRIIQEATNNTIRHSNAQNLRVSLSFEDHLFTLIIKDDGVGFDIETGNPWVGIGLQSIYQRSIIIGAEVAIAATRGNGTEIKLHLHNPDYVEYKER